MNRWLNKVHCGDALELMRRMPDKCVDLVLTDPPYGIGEDGKSNHSRDTRRKGKLIAATRFKAKEWDKVLLSSDTIHEMIRVSKNQILFGGNYYVQWLSNSPCWIVWDKDNSGDFADCELAWTSFKTAVRRFKWRWNGMLQQDMKNKEVRVHPTQKPVKLGQWVLKNYAKPGDIILDCCCGSGTFLVAAAQMGFQWIGIDKDPDYCALAEDRIRRETAQLNMFF